VDKTIENGPARLDLLPALRPEVADELTDDLSLTAVGTPFFEVDPVAALSVLYRHIGGIYHLHR
jgi:hypothetical protein